MRGRGYLAPKPCAPHAAPSHSLRRRLLCLVWAAIFLAAVLQALTTYRSALHQADQIFDEHLQQVARALRGDIALGALLADEDTLPGFDLYVYIWGAAGTPLCRSSRAGDDLSPLPTPDLPEKVRPLVLELNLLFTRLQQAFATQKFLSPPQRRNCVRP